MTKPTEPSDAELIAYAKSAYQDTFSCECYEGPGDCSSCLMLKLAKRLKEHVHALRRETLHKVELVKLLQRIAATDAVANWGDEDLYEDLMTTIGQHNAGAGGGVE